MDDFSLHNVLLVDDSPAFRKILTNVLTKEGFDRNKIVQAENGYRAIGSMKEKKPNLILCDLDMPHWDGIELLRQVKKDKEFKNIPFLLIASTIKKKEVRQAFKLGLDQFISKPFNDSDLMGIIKNLLKKSKNFGNKRVLVIDDSPLMREVIINHLQQIGFDIRNMTEAIDGLDALEKIDQERFDLILCDLLMPKINGIELLRLIRKEKENEFHETPFLMVSIETSQDKINVAINEGCNGFLTKPFNAEQMKELIEPLLKNQIL